MAMTLKEIYQALINDENLTDKDGNKVRIKDNKLVDENGIQSYVSFTNPEHWEIYKDPKDPKNWIGKMVYLWDEGDKQKVLRLLGEYYKDERCPFFSGGFYYQNCRPLTKEEVEQYLVKEN